LDKYDRNLNKTKKESGLSYLGFKKKADGKTERVQKEPRKMGLGCVGKGRYCSSLGCGQFSNVNSAVIVEPPTMNPDTVKETADNKLIIKAVAKKSNAKISQSAKKTVDKKLVNKKSTAKTSNHYFLYQIN
jgi:hypothetical protein